MNKNFFVCRLGCSGGTTGHRGGGDFGGDVNRTLFLLPEQKEKVQYNVTEHIVPSEALNSPSFVHFYPLERGLSLFFEELMK